MDIIHSTTLAAINLTNFVNLSWWLNVLVAALGLGMVIFFHELGHFMVAKWCGVYVERFSIGFGQPILARKWGETEYWLSWIPFGGYVKMRGQDDMDPGQMTDEQISEDPRSYTAKSVPQRMAIISAGVIMNIITGCIFFLIAFNSGVPTIGRQIGNVLVGSPGWTHGIQPGDVIDSINGRPIENYEDLKRATALSHGSLKLYGEHADGTPFDVELVPTSGGTVRTIGVLPINSLEVLPSPDVKKNPVALPGTAAARADFKPGDQIEKIDGIEISDYPQFQQILDSNADKSLTVTVSRKDADGKEASVELDLSAENFISLGLRMGMGKLEAVQLNSPAAQAGLKAGDLITKVDGQDVGHDIDPMRLTEYFSEHAGQPSQVTVSRDVSGVSEELTFEITPRDRAAWSEPPQTENAPLSIPSIGVAYHLVPNVFSVDENGPAAGQGIKPRDTITKVTLVRAPGVEVDGFPDKELVIDIGDDNWAYTFWSLQENLRTRILQISVTSPEDGETSRIVELSPKPVADWYLPTTRGLQMNVQEAILKANDFQSSFAMAGQYTIHSIEDIYLTLRGLFTRDISVKGLSGPVSIVRLAHGLADQGIGPFMRFLGLISVNLAVINFLPIPVLDGGHMVFLIWEGIARRKPPERVVAAATYMGLAFVLGLMVFVICLDFSHMLF